MSAMTEESPLILNDIENQPSSDLLNYQDSKGRNLLVIAVETNQFDNVQHLLSIGCDPDSSFQGESVVNMAYKQKHFDVVLELLKNNSKYPDGFDASATGYSDLIEFTKRIRDFHARLRTANGPTEEQIKAAMQSYPNLRQFYALDDDNFNRSAAYIALKRNKRDLYDLLKAHHITATNEELGWLRSSQVKASSDNSSSDMLFNNEISSSNEKLPDTMCTKSYLGNNLNQEELERRYNSVKTAFAYLNGLDDIRPVLKFLTLANDYKIVFDFAKSHSQTINMRMSHKSTKHIYIGAEELLEGDGKEPPLEIYAVIIKELTRYAMEQVYENDGIPYCTKDKNRQTEFKEAMADAKHKSLKEPAINQVFIQKYTHSREAELLATVPQLLVLYSRDKSKLHAKTEVFEKIFDFYMKRVVDDVQHKTVSTSDEVERFVLDLEMGQHDDAGFVARIKWWHFVVVALLLIFGVAGIVFLALAGQKVEESDETYSNCGIAMVESELIARKTVPVSRRGQWPWLAALYAEFDGLESYFCGATVISQSHVLTAAHCVSGLNNENMFVKLGSYNLTDSSEDHAVRRNISRVFTHPDYDANSTIHKSLGDIALIRLSQRVTFGKYIQPACFPRSNRIVTGVTGTVAGFGMTEKGESVDVARYTKLRVLSAAECVREDQKYSTIVSEKSFCGGESAEIPCRGVSGSGFYIRTGEKQQCVITGIVSQALDSAECDTSRYVAFVNVKEYSEWIVEGVTTCDEGENCETLCDLNPCGSNAKCILSDHNAYTCECLDGFKGNPAKGCVKA